MKTEFPSLITSDASSGLALASQLADRLQVQIEKANEKVERPGGMHFLLPPSVPKEVLAGVLFYAVAAANRGWVTN